jgi:flavin reductase (DIM6/NTAB) family NADH-FMN oxidoreductase RutF
MTVALRDLAGAPPSAIAFKDAMRRLVGGVSVITAGRDDARTGLTVTTAHSLSIDPPTMLVCVNRNASAWPVIRREGHFCVNILDARHQHIAERFAGRDGIKGPERYHGGRWRRFATGAFGLEDALAVIDCLVEEVIERHSHGIIIGAVQAIHGAGSGEALVYGGGRYRTLSRD